MGYSDVPNKDGHDDDFYDTDNTFAMTTTVNPNIMVQPMEIMSAPADGNTNGGEEWTKGVVQVPQYRDKWFGIAFLIHLGIVMTVACLYKTGTWESDPWEVYENDNEPADGDSEGGGGRRRLARLLSSSVGNNKSVSDNDVDVISFVTNLTMAMVATPILSIWTFTLIYKHAEKLIQTSLFFGIGTNILLGLIMLVWFNPLSSIIFFLFTALLVWYTKVVWHRIPFAAANLRTAVCAVKANIGMAAMGLLTIPLNMGWFVLWGYTFVHIIGSPYMQQQVTITESTDDTVFGTPHNHVTEEEFSPLFYMTWAVSLLSLYWTWQVIRNVFHTTVAGTIGTWWFLPIEASSCCSRGLLDSWSRSMTYSFGSICLGSLIVAILETIKSMVQSAARQRSGILRCIAQCLLAWLERIAEYFNKVRTCTRWRNREEEKPSASLWLVCFVNPFETYTGTQ
jgi:Plasma-membrane choline transporter